MQCRHFLAASLLGTAIAQTAKRKRPMLYFNDVSIAH